MARRTGLRDHPIYVLWANVVQRCQNRNRKGSHRYVGRGITMYGPWRNDFLMFRRWAVRSGWRPGLQIDRIDNDGDYTPDNCRFVTHRENCAPGRRRRPTHTRAHATKKHGLPLGVYKKRSKYFASKTVEGVRYRTSVYATVQEATEAYEKLGQP